MKKIGLLISVCLCCIAAFAVMATPEPMQVVQADGSTRMVRLVGDEFHSYYTDLQGTPLRRNAQGMWVADPTVAEVPSAAQKARRAARMPKTGNNGFPLTGSPKSVVILVNFSDLKFQFSLNDFQRMLNESGYSTNGGIGSARDYFIACSDSIFQPQFDCYGPINLTKGYAYYDQYTSKMVVEACQLLSQSGVNLAQYDTNNDGQIDNIFIYFAGHNEAEGASSGHIWPHRSVVTTGDRVDGKLIYDYACTSELRGSSGKAMCGIGTFCHEFGHVLGLPDYYDTGYTQYTVGTWDIMCSGSYNGNGKTPPSYTAGERFQLGWLTPVQLSKAGTYTLEPLTNGKHQVYLIAKGDHNLSFNNASPSEYWLLENRQRVGWDAPSTCLPGTGMLIWHIDYLSSAWSRNEPNNYTPLRYHVEEAGGRKGYSIDSDPYPGSKNVTTFTPTLHSGEMLEQPLTDIAQSGQNITFTYKANGFMFLPAAMPVIASTYNADTKKAYTPGYKLRIVGEHLDPNQDVSISPSSSSFNISKDSITWTSGTFNTLNATVNADSTMEQDIWVRYAPKKQVCDEQRGTISVRQGSSVGTLVVFGTSPRPVLIEAPDITTIENVTPTTFTVNWTPQDDAEYYYVTMYHMEEGTESTVESFEGFDDEATVAESGWSTSFYRTTTKAKEQGAVSMWFKENSEWMLTPIYSNPVVELSMWLNAPATTDSDVGLIYLVGYSDTSIDTLDIIHITKNTKKYTYRKTFTEEQGYRRFRLDYAQVGGEGVCLDAFTTTFNQKTVYTYKGRERTILAEEGYEQLYAYDLIPNTTYYVRLQCSEEKGCEEHLSELSMPVAITTKEGSGIDGNRLTYDPELHAVYLPQSLTSGSVGIYTTEGQLVKTIPVSATINIVPLPVNEMQHGAIYIIKYLPNDNMRRGQPWIKILFR